MRRFASLAAKALITGGLLYFAIGRANLSVIGDRLHRLDLAWMLLSAVIGLVQLGLVSIRWAMIAERCEAPLPIIGAFRFNLIAYFFNQILPSTVGGDAVRIWLFAREGAGWSKATYSVLVDRFIGVMALAAIVVATLPWSFDLIKNPIGRVTLLVIGFGSVGGGLCFLAMGFLRSSGLQKLMPVRHLTQLGSVTTKMLFSIRDGPPLIGLSLMVHVLTAGMGWSAARAIAAPVEFLQVLLLVTPVTLIVTIPLSIAGWGVRESALVLAFSYAGLPESDGLVISVLLGATMLAIGLIGGVVWLTSKLPLNPSAAWRSGRQPPE